jgi:hypothetical protein
MNKNNEHGEGVAERGNVPRAALCGVMGVIMGRGE